MICSSLTCATGCDHPAPHFPTSADLAAFRRAIRPAVGDLHPDASPDMAAFHGLAGAWTSELAGGIGYPAAEHRQPVYVTDPHDARSLLVMSANDADRLRYVTARTMAGAMRRDAWALLTFEAMGDAGLRDDLIAAARTFEPAPDWPGERSAW